MSDFGGISEEVRELRQEVARIRSMLAAGAPPAERAAVRLRIHVERCPGERKPYLLIFRSPAEKRLRMSATRAAITLTLLMDLDQRSSGLPGLLNTRELALEVLRHIDAEISDRTNDSANESDRTRAQEQVRLGFYRFGSFWQQELADVVPAHYDSRQERLVADDSSNGCRLEIVSADPSIEDALPQLGRPPMLERLRREKFLFVPAGGNGSESLLKEIYASPGRLNVVGTYLRPSLATVPEAIVEKRVQVPAARVRHRLIVERLKQQTLSLTEILPESFLDVLQQPLPDGSYPYLPGLTAAEAVLHLKHLEGLVLSDSGYRLLITRSDIPFYIGRYSTETFSLAVFLRVSQAPEQQNSYSCFAVWGTEIAAMSEATVLEWLLNHPSTTIAADVVAQRIREAYRAIEAR